MHDPVYTVLLVGRTGAASRVAADFRGDEPVGVACGNTAGCEIAGDYFVVRTAARRAFLFLRGDPRPVPLLAGVPVDGLWCGGARVFAASDLSVHVLTLGPGGAVASRADVALASPARAVFPCDDGEVGCYVCTADHRLYSLPPGRASAADLLCYRERVLRADCVRGCLAVVTESRRFVTLQGSRAFAREAEVAGWAGVREGAVPARVHRVAKRSVLCEMDPGVLWFDDRGERRLRVAACCTRSALKCVSAARREILAKEARGAPETRVFETRRQIVAFDELVGSGELVVVEREARGGARAALFEADSADRCVEILRAHDAAARPFPVAHPLDAQLLFAGIGLVSFPTLPSPPRDQLVHVLVAVSRHIDPLQFLAFIRAAFFDWILAADCHPLTVARLAELAAYAVQATPFSPAESPFPAPTPEQFQRIHDRVLPVLDSLPREQRARTLAALLYLSRVLPGDLLDLTLRCAAHCDVVPLAESEPLLEYLLIRSEWFDHDRMRIVADATLQIFRQPGASTALRQRIASFWSSRNNAVLQAALDAFVASELRGLIAENLRAVALLGEEEIIRSVRAFVARSIPAPEWSPAVQEEVLKSMAPAIRQMAAAGGKIVALRQRLVCHQEVENGLCALRLERCLAGAAFDWGPCDAG